MGSEPTTYYVIDAGGSIVNAISSRRPEDEVLATVQRTFVDGPDLTIDPNPPRAKLERYRYWNERP